MKKGRACISSAKAAINLAAILEYRSEKEEKDDGKQENSQEKTFSRKENK